MARQSVRLGLIAASSLLIVGMGSGFSAGKVARIPAATIPKLQWKGTITMSAAIYTPIAPGVKFTKGEARLTEFETLAKQFEKMYPGIKIRFISEFPGLTSEQVETKAAGGDMYDVYSNLYTNWNAVFAPGIVYNLDKYFNEPDPYIAGNKLWKNVMSTRVLEQTADAVNGAHYEVDADWVGTAFYYNKVLFAKAGIKAPPKTWTALINDEKTLTAHHIIAFAHIPGSYSWFSRLFLGNDITGTTLKELLADSKDKYAVTPLGEAIGYEKGIFNPSKNPRIQAWWPLMKQLYSYADKDVTDIPWDAVPTGAQTGTTLFAAGKVAMDYEGSWFPNTERLAGSKVPMGSFAFPAASLPSVFKYATKLNSSADVGGPSTAYEFAISTPKADASMKQPGKFQAVLDWVRYVSTPQRTEAVINQLGDYVPTFKGTVTLPSESGSALPKGAKYVSIFGFSDMSPQLHTEIGNLFQEYLEGDVSFATAKQEFDSDVAQGVQQYIATNHLHIS